MLNKKEQKLLKKSFNKILAEKKFGGKKGRQKKWQAEKKYNNNY